ncbi:MAG: Crp/Fnr family transcriptional regulator [Elusimicrobia bacterium]|nr:Crp/Fnr family transcriptional regulator [Elusimicrobiota bacterium]
MLRILRKIPFLSQLSPKDLNEIYKISKIREYGPGEMIFSKAESAQQMFIVLGGRVKIFARSGGRKRKTFAYLEVGDFFGEMALVEGKSRSASAEAVDYSKLLVIQKNDFKRLLISDPHLSYYLLKSVSERLRKANEEIEDLLFRNILGRVAKALAQLASRGKRLGDGVLLVQNFTQQELADLVGTTREPLTRALSTLRRAQLVEARKGRYWIRDMGKLQALCRTQS